MRGVLAGALGLGWALLGGCAKPEPVAEAPRVALEPKIAQLYAPLPRVPRGEAAKICYGVENAKSVWISPPVRELSAALARCIEVEPKGKTTYTLTAEGAEGKRVSQDITVEVGAPRAKIVNVDVSAVEVTRGQAVRICYEVEHALRVTVVPPRYAMGTNERGCAVHRPAGTTTYVVTAIGADGDRDEERVTVKVR